MKIINRIYRFIKGPYQIALKEGLKAGKGVSVVGSVNFGSEPYLITLGDYVRISMDVMFVNHDGGTWAFRDKEKYQDVIKYGKITIGDRTFIGARSIIMPGVNIGKRCVIGAGSVVTKDVPDGYVACGNPAKIIMSTAEYANKCYLNQREYDKKKYAADKKNYLEQWL